MSALKLPPDGPIIDYPFIIVTNERGIGAGFGIDLCSWSFLYKTGIE